MTATDLVRPEDLAIDHELADIASSIRFLLDVTPINLIEARRRFLDDGSARRSPTARCDDPAVVEARLAAATIDAVEDPALSHLLQAKHRELELQLEMLRQRGTDEFLGLSVQLYGTVSPALAGRGRGHCSTPGASRQPSPVHASTPAAFARLAEAELDHYRAVSPISTLVVEMRQDSSGVMVSNGNLLIAPTVAVPEARVHALLQHEIGTHIVTHVNGSRQPLRLLGAGLAGYDETQEGLAVFAEYLAGGLTARRLRQLAARVVAVHQMTEGETFPTVHAASSTAASPRRGVHDHDARVPVGRADQGRGVPARAARRHRLRRRRRRSRRAVARQDGAHRRPPHRGAARPRRPRRTGAGAALSGRAGGPAAAGQRHRIDHASTATDST